MESTLKPKGGIKRILFILSISLCLSIISFSRGAGAYFQVISPVPFPSLEFSKANRFQEKASPGDFLRRNRPTFSKIAYALEREAKVMLQIGRSA